MNAEVAVFGFTLKPVTYTYKIPYGWTLSPGQLVIVPFGKRPRSGVVVKISGDNSQFNLKEITKVVSSSPILSTQQLHLAERLAAFYFISIAEALRLMLPKIPDFLANAPQAGPKKISQELFLFPTLKQASQAQQNLGGVVFSHAGPATLFSRSWQTVQSGEVSRVLGSRTALFAPFKALRKITIFQTESDIYKEERRPYYRSLQVAKMLASVSGADLQAVSFSPRVQDHFEIPHLIKKTRSGSTKVIDLRNKPVVNDELKELLAITKSGKILLFLNRKSDKGALVCRTCKLRSYTDDPSLCPNCGGSDIRFQLFNLQKVAKKLTLPATAQVTYGTQQIFFQDMPYFDLIVVLSADTYFSRPSYDSAERTFQMITSLKKLLSPNGLMVVQTGFPDHSAIKYSLQGNYQKFYEEELPQRTETGYPPYNKLAKLTYAAPGPVPELNLGSSCQVFGPFEGSKFTYFVVRGRDLSTLSSLKRPWKLDIDPLSL